MHTKKINLGHTKDMAHVHTGIHHRKREIRTWKRRSAHAKSPFLRHETHEGGCSNHIFIHIQILLVYM